MPSLVPRGSTSPSAGAMGSSHREAACMGSLGHPIIPAAPSAVVDLALKDRPSIPQPSAVILVALRPIAPTSMLSASDLAAVDCTTPPPLSPPSSSWLPSALATPTLRCQRWIYPDRAGGDGSA
ncbi:Os04g0140533 [Oryza sativa Japonica Group]|uniref:Os04g0140533 protein n=1 Tax=Oryza sativa subsp. japonica TaxID=39947 RepID=A0A0N7KIJ1_ORYSJ|nr:Os04g0140533 [Oryza sativa Japonica Group]